MSYLMLLGMAGFLFILGVLNTVNYPFPKQWYRTFNKVFYKYFMMVAGVMSFVSMLMNIKRFLNPFENFKQPSNPSHLEYLGSAAVNGVGVAIALDSMKDAEVVELYFQQRAAGGIANAPDAAPVMTYAQVPGVKTQHTPGPYLDLAVSKSADSLQRHD